jgi:hypothetical protein
LGEVPDSLKSASSQFKLALMNRSLLLFARLGMAA